MEVKEAVKKALAYVEEAFSDGGLSDLGLEEVVYDDLKENWQVTVGFSRPWHYVRDEKGAMVDGNSVERDYKVVVIRDSDGTVTAIRDRRCLV